MPYYKSIKRIPVGRILFPVILIVIFILYGVDIYTKARNITDWILIVPIAVIGVMALTFIALGAVRDLFTPLERQSHGADHEDPAPSGKDAPQALLAVIFMVLLTIYVFSIPYIGFDLSTFLFLCLTLRLQGETNWLKNIIFGFSSSVVIVMIFVNLLSVRLYTLVL